MALAEEATPPDFTTRQQPTAPQNVLDLLDDSAGYVRQTLPIIDDGGMRDTFKIVRAGRTLMSLPRAEFLRSIMLNYWYHHRGQLGVYLRLLGALVPSSYGQSGDEYRPSLGEPERVQAMRTAESPSRTTRSCRRRIGSRRASRFWPRRTTLSALRRAQPASARIAVEWRSEMRTSSTRRMAR